MNAKEFDSYAKKYFAKKKTIEIIESDNLENFEPSGVETALRIGSAAILVGMSGFMGILAAFGIYHLVFA